MRLRVGDKLTSCIVRVSDPVKETIIIWKLCWDCSTWLETHPNRTPGDFWDEAMKDSEGVYDLGAGWSWKEGK